MSLKNFSLIISQINIYNRIKKKKHYKNNKYYFNNWNLILYRNMKIIFLIQILHIKKMIVLSIVIVSLILLLSLTNTRLKHKTRTIIVMVIVIPVSNQTF